MAKLTAFLKRHGLFLILFFLLASWIAISYLSGGVFHALLHSDTQSVLSFIQSFGELASVVFVLLVILEVVLAPLPPIILYVVAGLLFGSLYGGLLVLLGNLVGALIDFTIARNLFRKGIEGRTDRKTRERFNEYFKKYGWLAVFFLRINPLTSSDLVSYLSGLTSMRLSRFLLATAAGLTPLIFLQTYLGESLIRGNPLLLNLTIFFSVLYLAAFIYLIWYSLKNSTS